MLTKEQSMALNHLEGPALVLAVPGAGKTTVLIHRTAKLILDQGVDPKRILSITFSRQSANDMKERFNLSFPQLSNQVYFSTIHSFCFRLINEYAIKKQIKFTMIEDSRNKYNKYSILRNIYSSINREFIKEDKMESLLNNIGYVKNMMLGEEDFPKTDVNNFKEIFREYERIKKDNLFLDFDDMLSLSYRILREDPFFLAKYRGLFDYIQLDEGQDTSRLQLEIIKLIAQPRNNIFIVADDDQSIYGFRGANPRELFRLKDDLKDLKFFYMQENFRSSNNIVSLSNRFIKTNKNRFEKEVYTKNCFLEPINIVKINNINQQYDYIIGDIKDKGSNNNAILYRNNISSINLINRLYLDGLDFRIKDSSQRFFKHWLIKDMLSFLYLAQDPSDIASFENIYYKMKGYISKQHIAFVKQAASEESVFKTIASFPDLPNYYQDRLRDLDLDLRHLASLKPYEALGYIEKDLEYANYLREYSEKFGYNYNNLSLVLKSLKNIAQECQDLKELLDKLATIEELSKTSSTRPAPITLSTIHSAKGLEFDNVYIIDVYDGNFPLDAALENQEDKLLEEERRLFYVAMTRAKYYLTIIQYDRIDSETIRGSAFIDELSKNKKTH